MHAEALLSPMISQCLAMSNDCFTAKHCSQLYLPTFPTSNQIITVTNRTLTIIFPFTNVHSDVTFASIIIHRQAAAANASEASPSPFLLHTHAWLNQQHHGSFPQLPLLSLHPCSAGSSSTLRCETGHGVDSTPNLFSNPSH